MDFGSSPSEGSGLWGVRPGAEVQPAPTVREAVRPEPRPPLEPPSAAASLTPAQPRVPAPRPEPAQPPQAEDDASAPSPWPIYLTAMAVSVLWALGPIAFAVGYRRAVAPMQTDAFALSCWRCSPLGRPSLCGVRPT